MKNPYRVIAQVMNFGTLDDWHKLIDACGEDSLRATLMNSKAGWFCPKRWTFWHYCLNVCELDHVPPLPRRTSVKRIRV